jgi:conjugative transfer region protein TrbK
MRGNLFNWPAIGRAAGYVAVAAAIVAAAVQFRHEDPGRPAPVSPPSAAGDTLAPELARCQAIGMAAKDDAGCEAVWAENRRRFFTYRPAPSAESAPPAPAEITPKSKEP